MRTALTPAQLANAASCPCFGLRKAARAVTQVYDDILRPSGLRGTQFSLLTVLASMGTVSITRLADEAVMDRTTLARNLALLPGRARLGLIARHRTRREGDFPWFPRYPTTSP